MYLVYTDVNVFSLCECNASPDYRSRGNAKFDTLMSPRRSSLMFGKTTRLVFDFTYFSIFFLVEEKLEITI